MAAPSAMPGCKAMPDNPIDLSQAVVAGRVQAALRLHVGRGRRWTVKELSRDTGIDPRTVESYLDGENCPSVEKLLRIARVLPADFLDMVLALIGMGGVEPIAPATADAFALMADAAGITAGLAEALRDGTVDRRERLALAPRLRAAASRLEAAAASYERVDD
jgi:transcriptional regulator with XRE-family HTH domain